MSKRGGKAPITADVKLKGSVTASYTRKRTTTEVIPADVTRAKAGSWLDVISPITEWAGLRGDALRYQREQLRIRQEAALEQLALYVREAVAGKTIAFPLPPKIVIPALEGASLEQPDSPLLQWWGRLLASGATRAPIRPYLIDLMSKIGPQEAVLLESLWESFLGSKTVVSYKLNVSSPGVISVINLQIVTRINSEFESTVSKGFKSLQLGCIPLTKHNSA
jgi:hypothetical protein